jgi:hypothetical protein
VAHSFVQLLYTTAIHQHYNMLRRVVTAVSRPSVRPTIAAAVPTLRVTPIAGRVVPTITAVRHMAGGHSSKPRETYVVYHLAFCGLRPKVVVRCCQ